MLAAGLCTESQYNTGMTKLKERLTRYYKSKGSNAVELDKPTAKDEFDDNYDDEEMNKSPYVKSAKDEIKQF